MSSLDGFMGYLVACVFLCVGFTKIVSYKRRPKSLGARPASLLFGLPYGCIVAVGLFEIVAALALVTPFGLLPQVTLAQLAAVGLALLTLAAAVYHARRHESAITDGTLFLLVMFVIVGHSM